MRATNHSGRKGSASHNDRTFDVDKAQHIDQKRMGLNEYGCIYEGMTFEDAEREYYGKRFAGHIEAVNARAKKSRHHERMTDADKLYESQKTKPEEVIFQIGDKDSSVSGEELLKVYEEYREWHNERFGDHVTILDWTLHVDERTPHIHERRVWEYDHKDGYRAIGQHEALKALGYTLPNEKAERGRQNNLKVPYTQECREKWLDICYEHGYEVERTPKEVAPNKQNMDKRDFIIENQKRQLEEQQRQLDETNRILSVKNAQIERLNEKRDKARAKVKIAKKKVTMSRDEYTEYQVTMRENAELKAREEYVNQQSLEARRMKAEADQAQRTVELARQIQAHQEKVAAQLDAREKNLDREVQQRAEWRAEELVSGRTKRMEKFLGQYAGNDGKSLLETFNDQERSRSRGWER